MLKDLKRSKGFTIVEVMIVLAIAGLIILIVFMAVPALQRSSRNTQARSAAAAILTTVNEYISNNGGTMPTDVSIENGVITVTGDGANDATSKTREGYTANADGDMPEDPGIFSVNLNTKCDSTGTDFGDTAARAISVGYVVETGSDVASQCTEN